MTFAAIFYRSTSHCLLQVLLPVSQQVLKVKLRDSNIDSGAVGMVNVFPARPASNLLPLFFFLKRHTRLGVRGVVQADTNKKNRFAVRALKTDSQCSTNMIMEAGRRVTRAPLVFVGWDQDETALHL